MASVSEQLLAALDDLDTDELKRFKWRIKNYYGVSAADLKKADAPDTVDLMMKCFGAEEAVTITVDILRKMNQNHLAEELEKKHKQDQAESSKEYPAFVGAQSKPINVTFTNIDLWTRNDFLQYSHQLTPDLNTANNYICLSESSRVITATGEVQPYPDHPDRFNECQVLCRESVCGRCYWEIEWSGGDGLFISVSYKSISRKGDADCLFGSNDKSWSLICCLDRYLFMHNNIVTDLSGKPISSRIGVYVDHSEGTLSFYSVSDTMSLIRTVQTTFTQPLYPGFRFYSTGSSVKLC